MKVKSLSRVRLFVTLWTEAYQAPPSMGFSRQEYWSGVPLPSTLDHLSHYQSSIESNNTLKGSSGIYPSDARILQHAQINVIPHINKEYGTGTKTMERDRKARDKHMHYHHLIGEGNGTPLQYSCLENSMDGGAW